MFPALRKTSEHSTASRALKFFLRAGNNLVVLKNSTEHAETLFIALFESVCIRHIFDYTTALVRQKVSKKVKMGVFTGCVTILEK